MNKKLSLRVRERHPKVRGWGGGGGLKPYIIVNLFSLLFFLIKRNLTGTKAF